ncbi:MAG: extracellular solute-binding protein [Candidatus Paceibacterota bacterium]|jgi:multiple sugar transport system substrate-binding protein
MKNFQIILIGVFIFFLVLAVLIFSGTIPIGSKGTVSGVSGNVVMWGTTDKNIIRAVTETINSKYEKSNISVKYEQKNINTFDQELIEALASGTGPDLVLLPNDLIIKYLDKVFITPYANYPKRTFMDTFISEGNICLTTTGISAFPLVVDPLVMYYNKDFFEDAGIAKPPENWDEFKAVSSLLTKKESGYKLLKSGAALGEFDNIKNAKDIISMLLLQTGNPIVAIGKDNSLVSTLGSTFGQNLQNNGDQAVGFYMEFSNSNSKSYSWSKSMSLDRDAFVAGDLAIYFGYASELFDLRNRNSNLNFDVAKVPQIKDYDQKATFGKMTSVSIMKNSKNINTAYYIASIISSPEYIGYLSKSSSISPARRDLLTISSESKSDPYISIFYNSALISKGWLDPQSSKTDGIFIKMINNISSGRSYTADAVSDASDELDILLKSIKI